MNNQQDFNNLFRQNNLMNVIEIISLLVGLESLQENREQSAHNDVQSANDKQARYILNEINKKFDEQNQMLKKMMLDIEDIKYQINI